MVVKLYKNWYLIIFFYLYCLFSISILVVLLRLPAALLPVGGARAEVVFPIKAQAGSMLGKLRLVGGACAGSLLVILRLVGGARAGLASITRVETGGGPVCIEL